MNKVTQERLLKVVIESAGDICAKKFINEKDLNKLGYKFGENAIVINAKIKNKAIDYTVIEVKDIDDQSWIPSFCLLKVSTYKLPFTLNYPYKRYVDIYNSK